MRVGFIGAGKVGFSLGKYLVSNNVTVTGYFSKSSKSAKLAADFTSTKAYSSLENILEDSDTVFLTVPDDIIGEVWENIRNLDIKNKKICHCSGSIASTAFFVQKMKVRLRILSIRCVLSMINTILGKV